MLERLLNVKEVSQILNVKEGTIYDWVSQNYIPHFKISKFVRFNEAEILEWLNKKHIKGRNTNAN